MRQFSLTVWGKSGWLEAVAAEARSARLELFVRGDPSDDAAISFNHTHAG